MCDYKRKEEGQANEKDLKHIIIAVINLYNH